ncbi:hypothetical protein [Frigoriflavimonas asaccharolytica]|uniref:Uncharacterized protein n=1 Tax=Frigoriflavimonas asaccharolytica TaxID=2735899 RepID=A0A8J8G6Y0_9FLAO|nr:hypothetical protein [Frigoriflavimonas asaccharolytica]NRS91107.1 hypothetical protein [Frigoriflavimonas asaccharolytica]
MNLETIQSHIDAYKSNNQILDAASHIISSFNLDHENFAGLDFREELSANSILLTAEGALGESQIVRIPRNLFDFDLKLVLNLLAHEMLHVRQKAPGNFIVERNEREFQAYYEMLFHKIFPQIPDASHFSQKQFAEKALEYYKRMGENSDLQIKYAEQKIEVEKHLEKITI